MSRLDVADQWAALMTTFAPEFVAHGSDLGAGVVAQIASRHPEKVAALHLATPGWAPLERPRSRAEERYAMEVEQWAVGEGAYAHVHATKPETLAAALHDSPAGLAAWIGEKLHAWGSGSDTGSRRLLLETLTLYWVTGSIGSSMLPYWHSRRHPETTLAGDNPAPVPTSVSIFGGEHVPLPHPPRELGERYVNVVRWEEHGTGGHFPAAAEPELFAGSLRRAFQAQLET